LPSSLLTEVARVVCPCHVQTPSLTVSFSVVTLPALSSGGRVPARQQFAFVDPPADEDLQALAPVQKLGEHRRENPGATSCDCPRVSGVPRVRA
jgi:hypothetical protein